MKIKNTKLYKRTVVVLMGTPESELIEKAKSNFSEAGYFVESKDIYETVNKLNPYDHYMTSEYWVKLR